MRRARGDFPASNFGLMTTAPYRRSLHNGRLRAVMGRRKGVSPREYFMRRVQSCLPLAVSLGCAEDAGHDSSRRPRWFGLWRSCRCRGANSARGGPLTQICRSQFDACWPIEMVGLFDLGTLVEEAQG